MKDKIFNQIQLKTVELQNINIDYQANPSRNIKLKKHLLEQANIYYLPVFFSEEDFIDKLLEFVKNEDFQYEHYKEEELHFINYKKTSGFKKTIGISNQFCLFFIKFNDVLLFDVKEKHWIDNWQEQEEKFKLGKLLSDSYFDEINGFIRNYLLNNAEKHTKLKISDINQFIEIPNEKFVLWFYTYQSENEHPLVLLEVSQVKDLIDNNFIEKKLNWFYFLSSEKSLLLAFNNEYELLYFENLANKKLTVRDEIGRNTVNVGETKWLTNRSNAKLYLKIKELNDLEPISKIRQTARLNWLHQEKDHKSNKYAYELLKHVADCTDNHFDKLSVLFVEFVDSDRNEVFSSNINDIYLVELFRQILNDPETDAKLTKWFNDWKISTFDSVAIMQLLLTSAENTEQLQRILPFHNLVRDNLKKHDKDAINQIVFDINYCKHLLKCKENKKVVKIMQKHLKHLPDETLSDLLPPDDIDLTGKASGQVLKLSILEILAQAQEKEDSASTILQITKLQPLVGDRIEKLKGVAQGDLKQKSNELISLLNSGKINQAETEISEIKQIDLTENEMEQTIKHKAAQKGGVFDTIQKWIAEVEVPDYSIIKTYSELITKESHAELHNVICNISNSFGIDNLEAYIARGEKSIGITAYEANPSFLVIGIEHLETDNENYLSKPEISFVIAAEMAHLYYKHARISSNDLWKGVVSKSTLMFETIINIIPVLGIVGKSISTMPKLNKLANLLQQSSKIGKIGNTGKDIINSTKKLLNLYHTKIPKSTDSKKEEEFIAISRIMQFTADRAGLIFTDNIKSAIRAIFLTDKNISEELKKVEQIGLNEYLLEKKNDIYINQALALRFANLFSFYISEEFENIEKKLKK